VRPGTDGSAGGNPWDRVRPRRRLHRCVPQSCLTWTFRTKKGTSIAAVLWCSCGAVRYPGVRRWLGKNIRGTRLSADFPFWHTTLIDLDRPVVAHERLRDTDDTTNLASTPDGWRHRMGDKQVMAGGEIPLLAEHTQEPWLSAG
jgi:hypothetical protein